MRRETPSEPLLAHPPSQLRPSGFRKTGAEFGHLSHFSPKFPRAASLTTGRPTSFSPRRLCYLRRLRLRLSDRRVGASSALRLRLGEGSGREEAAAPSRRVPRPPLNRRPDRQASAAALRSRTTSVGAPYCTPCSTRRTKYKVETPPWAARATPARLSVDARYLLGAVRRASPPSASAIRLFSERRVMAPSESAWACPPHSFFMTWQRHGDKDRPRGTRANPVHRKR